MRMRFLHGVLPLAALITLALQGCGSTDPSAETGAGAGGSGGNGGSAGGGGNGGDGGNAKEEPDYAKAFPQDRVPRIDIVITPESWQAMIDDMTDMLGAPGSGGPGPGGGGMEPPPELAEACNGLMAGDACSATMMGTTFEGTCTDALGSLLCLPEGGPGGPGGPGPGGGGGVDLLPRTPIYVECDVTTEDRSWQHVGIRFKGNSSLAMSWQQGIMKLPLRFNWDKFEDTYPEIENQRFYGFDSLSFSNGASDSSLLRDKIGTEVFVNAKIPAPATAFYRVFIDHGEGPTYFGLYTGIELPEDDAFLETHFGNKKGNLYKPDGEAARWATWDTETLGLENNDDAPDHSDAQALFDALHADRTDAAAWREKLENRLDVDRFLHWLALNAVIEDWDQYGRMPHNYYLYADPDKNAQFTWIPWDHSFAFPAASGSPIGGQAMSLSMAEVTDQWPLIRYLLDDPVYFEKYRAYVALAAEKEYEPVSVEARFKAAHDLIAPYVVGPEGEIPGYTFLASPAAFDEGLAGVIMHVKERQADVAAFLGP